MSSTPGVTRGGGSACNLRGETSPGQNSYLYLRALFQLSPLEPRASMPFILPSLLTSRSLGLV